MKKVLILFLLLATALTGKAQSGFSLEGVTGIGLSKNQDLTPLILNGRVFLNNNLSAGLGLGLWNSGYKRTWYTETDQAAVLYKLSDNKTLPSLSGTLRYSLGLCTVGQFPVRIFIEPGVLMVPLTNREATLTETHFVIKEVNGIKEVTPDDPSRNKLYHYKSGHSPHFALQMQGGLSVTLKENIDLNIGYSLSTLDLYKPMRGEKISGFSFDNYLPKKGIQLITIGLQYKYNL